MGFIFREFDKYSIRGKIIDINNDSSTLTISVNSPFVGEIEFHCSSDYYDMLHPPAFKYNWISWVRDSEHPSVTEASAYYNTTHKCFYTKVKCQRLFRPKIRKVKTSFFAEIP